MSKILKKLHGREKMTQENTKVCEHVGQKKETQLRGSISTKDLIPYVFPYTKIKNLHLKKLCIYAKVFIFPTLETPC